MRIVLRIPISRMTEKCIWAYKEGKGNSYMSQRKETLGKLEHSK